MSRCASAPVRLAGARQRVLLAVLPVNLNELVTVDQLAEPPFGERRRERPVN